jgi:hypothetical protein
MFKANETNVMAQHKFYFQNCFGVYNSVSKGVCLMYAERLKLHIKPAKQKTD